MQVALGQQLFFDAGFDALAKQGAVGQHQGGAATGLQDVFDEHQKQVGRFFGANVCRKALFNARLFHAAKGRVGQDHVHPVGGGVVAQGAGQGVIVPDGAGHLNAMQHEVGHAQHVRQLLLFHAVDAGLQRGILLGRVHLFAQVFNGAHQKAAGAGGRVQQGFAPLGVGLVHHELGDGAGGVELARVACALQVAQNFFVQVVELVALGLAVEVHPGQLVDDLAQQVAAFHVVEGVLKHAAHHKAARVAHGVGRQVFEGDEQLGVHKVEQVVAGDALGVGGPVAPAHGLGQRALVVVAGEFQLFFQRVEHFQKQQPGELADALGIAVHPAVLPHDVLNGLDGGGEVGHVFFMNEKVL